MNFDSSVTAMSPADRMRPPSSRSRRLSPLSLLSKDFARRRASSITTPTASRVAGGMRLSTAISCATNCTSFARLTSESAIVVSTSTSYPAPVIRERSGDKMCGRSWMLHAPTKMKSHGTLSTFTLAPALCGFLPEIGNRFSCIAVRMNRWRKPNCGSSSINRTPWWASWIAPATTRSYGWVPSCGWPPYGSCRTSPRSSVSLAPVASTNGLRAIGTRTFRGLSFSTSRRFSSAFWSRTRIMSPARSYTTTSSLPNCCRVVVTRSRPWSCANVTSKMPPSRSPNGFPTFAWDAAFGRPHFGHMRSVGDEYVPQWTHLYPSRSATLIGASFGSIKSPSAPASRFRSCSASSARYGPPRSRSQVAPGPDFDAGGLLRDRAHLRADDGVHVHLRGNVQDPLRDDPVEDDRSGLLRGLERVHELPHRDLRDDAIPFIEETRRRGPAELDQHVAVLLQFRAEDLRGRRHGVLVASHGRL